MPVCNDQSGTSFLNHSTEKAGSEGTCPDQINGITSKEPPLLRELDANLLQSGKLQLTGKILYLTLFLCNLEKAFSNIFCFENFKEIKDNYIMIIGTVDRMGRGLVFTDADAPEEGFCAENMAQTLACYHRITR